MLTTFVTVCQSLCRKWELFLSSTGMKVNGQHCWDSDILLSQQMLDGIIASCTWCILHSTQSNCCSAKLSTSFLLSYDPMSLIPLTLSIRNSCSSISMSCKRPVEVWQHLTKRMLFLFFSLFRFVHHYCHHTLNFDRHMTSGAKLCSQFATH